MAKTISGRQLAKLLDISHTMVGKYVRRGMPTNSASAALAWLSKNSGGRFSEESAAAAAPDQEEVPTRPASRSRAAAASETASETADDLEELSQAALTKRYTAARIKLTERDTEIRRLRGLQAQMDADLRDGRLRPAEEVRRVNAEASATLRDRLLAKPAELAVRLAAMNDPAEIAALLRGQLKDVLNDWLQAIGVPAGN